MWKDDEINAAPLHRHGTQGGGFVCRALQGGEVPKRLV